MSYSAARSALLLMALLLPSAGRAEAQQRYGAPAPEELRRTMSSLAGALFDSFNRWQQKDGAWMITRVISYDHGPAPK